MSRDAGGPTSSTDSLLISFCACFQTPRVCIHLRLLQTGHSFTCPKSLSLAKCHSETTTKVGGLRRI